MYDILGRKPVAHQASRDAQGEAVAPQPPTRTPDPAGRYTRSLGVLSADTGASARVVGLVPTLTQLGYAMGILFLAPLGDRYDRRSIILAKAVLLCAALLLAAAAPSIATLLVASLVIGLSATIKPLDEAMIFESVTKPQSVQTTPS